MTTMFASGENAAVSGDFRYKSRSLEKMVTSPFSILVKVFNGKVTYLQFLEDSYATATSFRKDGSWTVHTEASAEPFQTCNVACGRTRFSSRIGFRRTTNTPVAARVFPLGLKRLSPSGSVISLIRLQISSG